ILVPAIIPGRIWPGHLLGRPQSTTTMWVRSPAARSSPPVPTASTPAPESPGADGPYQANAVPCRAVQIGATPARAVPPVPTTTPWPNHFTTVGSELLYTPCGPPHTSIVGFTHPSYLG